MQDGVAALSANVAAAAHAKMMESRWADDVETPAVLEAIENEAFRKATADWPSPPQSGHNCFVYADE
jgi:hypothetical protein